MFRDYRAGGPCPFHVALLAAACLLAGGGAMAQVNEAITVVAPHKVTHKMVGQSSTGFPVEEMSLSHEVYFADLDLTKTAGAQALKQRVAAMATESCRQLETLYPNDPEVALPGNKTCVQAAVDASRPQVEAAILQARK
jgi:UrcA family protein